MPSAAIHRLEVVAGILIDSDNRVLIAKRVGDDSFQGMWEFPGGKIAPGESPTSALARELAEEIGVVVHEVESFMCIEHDYPDRSVRLHFFKVHDWRGEATGLEAQKVRWVAPADIDMALMLPADAPVIAALLTDE